MNIQLHKKDIVLSVEEEEYITKKIESLEKISDKIIGIKVDVMRDTHHQTGDVCTVHLHIDIPKREIMTQETQSTPKAAIDVAVDEMKRQLRTYKEKLQSKNLRLASKKRQ